MNRIDRWKCVLVAGALFLTAAAQAKEHCVFAHFMVCMPWNGEATVEAYKYQIALAQRHGIDGFALNCGSWEKDPYYIERSTLLFEAAKQLNSGFKLFFSIDTATGLDPLPTAMDMMRRFASHPNQFRHDGKPVLSAYTSKAGPRWQEALAALKAAGTEVCFVPFIWTKNYTLTPSYDGVLNTLVSAPDADGYFLFGIDAPVQDLIKGNSNARRATEKLGKLYMATSSFAYNSANLRDFHGMRDYAALWENIIRDGADWVEIVTWNDYDEDSHLAPGNNTGTPMLADDQRDRTYDHDESFLDLTAYYSAWFKSGQPPEILQEKIYYVYRNLPKTMRDVYDARNKTWIQIPDQIHDDVEDNIYVAALLKEPAELTIHIGKTAKTFPLTAGISHVELPFEPGVPRFQLQRNDRTLVDVVGSREILDAADVKKIAATPGENGNSFRPLPVKPLNGSWSGGACLGNAVRYDAKPDPDAFHFATRDLRSATYNVRINYTHPTNKESHWTLTADGTQLKKHFFPVILPPTNGKQTVSFLWSLAETTATLTLQRDWGEAQISSIELVPVVPMEIPAKTTQAIFPSLVPIPAGSFTMGSKAGESDELPAHTVSVSAFQIGRHEVTNAEFEQLEPTHRQFRDEYSWRDSDPVIYVSWQQAAGYCNWLSEQAGLTPAYDPKTWEVTLRAGYRLPTEAEWEYVATGRDEGRPYPWGTAKPDATRGNFLGAGTVPVGSFPAGASRDGVMDLAGNVFEWCTDWYHPYPKEKQADPCNIVAAKYRVIRGGSWGYYGKSQRCTDREFNSQNYPGFYYGGFRVVLPEPLRTQSEKSPE